MTAKARFILLAAVLLTICQSAAADNAQIRDVDIAVVLSDDGGADVCELWDMSSTRGTEMYLVKSNLTGMVISDLKVSDNGTPFSNVGEWDIDRSFEEKAGKCGMVTKRDGCEICWGLGFYGEHLFKVEYHLSSIVKGFSDYDALHFQFVSPGISPYPQHVTVTIEKPGYDFNEENCGIWSFGYNGTVSFSDGKIIAETSEPFSSDDYSVILLSRFGKGVFTPEQISGVPFQEELETAFYGSSYEEYLKNQKRENLYAALFGIAFFGFIILMIFFAAYSVRKRNEHMFGVAKIKEIGYERDIPFDGNLYETLHVLRKCGRAPKGNTIASALVLRMIYDGYLIVRNNQKDRIEIAFNDSPDIDRLERGSRMLYDMMRQASGKDEILQRKEFSRWSKFHTEEVKEWCDYVEGKGRLDLSTDNYALSSKFNEKGQMHARRAIGFKQYLQDFTLLNERGSKEVVLWREYLVYASLYGIADKVAKELQDIDPQAFETYVGYSPTVMNRVLYLSDNMGANITNAVAVQTAESVAGHGGFSSFGGGGGFSGGGFGGGVR